MTIPTTIEQYLDAFSEPALSDLRQLRRICARAAPQCSEQIRWGHPAYVHPEDLLTRMITYRLREVTDDGVKWM